MKRLILILLLVACLGATAALAREIRVHSSAEAMPMLFLDLWNNASFYDTNLEQQRFSSILGRFEGKIGLNVFTFPIQVYTVYYGAASQSPDYWNNYIFSGYGARFLPLRDYPGTSWANEWLKGIKFYYEDLSSSYLKNAASAESLAKTDNRYGIEIWHEWNLNNPDPRWPWGELWSKFEYRETNFGWEEFRTQVFIFQPKFGIHLNQGVEAYVRADVTTSGKEGPDYSFLNIADYGVGLRFVPLRSVGKQNDLFRNLKIFAEILGVSYLKDEPTDPTKRVSSDVRFGIEFAYGR